MTETEFLTSIHRRLSIIAVGASALRNQGAAGIIDKARVYFFDKINLDEFFRLLTNQTAFSSYLDKHTVQLVQTFAEGGQSWGAARKGLNLFFREVVYNRFLSDHYNLPTNFADYNIAIRNLEVPLDKDVGTKIFATNNDLLKWTSIKTLQKPISDKYQATAQDIADTMDIARVHLDLIYWRQTK